MVYGQERDFIVDRSYDQLSWKEFTLKVQNTFPIRFFYDPDSIPDFKVVPTYFDMINGYDKVLNYTYWLIDENIAY